jgi:hypothetical protein
MSNVSLPSLIADGSSMHLRFSLVFKDNWRDQRGVLQSAVTYELCLEDYLTHHG